MIPQGLCVKCQESFMNCKCEQFHPSSSMIQDGDNFLFVDEYNTVWKLTRTSDPDMPLTITPLRKN